MPLTRLRAAAGTGSRVRRVKISGPHGVVSRFMSWLSMLSCIRELLIFLPTYRVRTYNPRWRWMSLVKGSFLFIVNFLFFITRWFLRDKWQDRWCQRGWIFILKYQYYLSERLIAYLFYLSISHHCTHGSVVRARVQGLYRGGDSFTCGDRKKQAGRLPAGEIMFHCFTFLCIAYGGSIYNLYSGLLWHTW